MEPPRRASLLPTPVPASEIGKSPTLPILRSLEPRRFPMQFLVLSILLPLLLIGAITAAVTHRTATHVTITVMPQEVTEQQQISLTATTTHPAPGQLQIQSMSEASTRQTTVTATGQKTDTARAAQGTITFYNLLRTSQTVPAGTILTATNGTQVVTLTQAVVPPASGDQQVTMGFTTVPAQATQAGPSGNLPVGAILTSCCTADATITAKNTTPFTGGQEAGTYTVIQQQDIDKAAQSLTQAVTRDARAQLVSKLPPSSQSVDGSLTCTAQTPQSSGQPGQKATTFTVSVMARCRAESYQRNEAEQAIAAKFTTAVARRLGPPYQLAKALYITTAKLDRHVQEVYLLFEVSGTWSYQVNRRVLQGLLPYLAGKSWQEAQERLRKQPGVAHVTVSDMTGSTLPSTPGQITLLFRT